MPTRYRGRDHREAGSSRPLYSDDLLEQSSEPSRQKLKYHASPRWDTDRTQLRRRGALSTVSVRSAPGRNGRSVAQAPIGRSLFQA
jgi:hypothetical protein